MIMASPSMAALHCHLCENETFLRQEDLLKHYGLRHFYQELLGKEDLEYYHRIFSRRPYVCNSCKYYATDEEKMMLHIAIEHSVIVDILEEKENEMIPKTQYDSELQRTKYRTPAKKSDMPEHVKRRWIIKECAEEMISVAYLARRWRCSSNSIEGLVKEAGLKIPEQNIAAIYPETPFRPKNCQLVFCHLELLRSSSYPTIYLTQLAATNANNNCNIFVPIVPSILENLSDMYSVGNLLEAMKIVKDDQGSFLFRDQVSMSETRRLECVEEEKALELFFKYLELAGPNVVLVGVDEDAIGVLLQKLEEHNASKLLELVVGYTWWSRILGGGPYHDLGLDWNLDDFYTSKIGDGVCCKGRRLRKQINTCPVVVKKLRAALRYVANEEAGISHFESVDFSEFADGVGISMLIEPRVPEEQMEAFEDFVNKEEERKEMVQLTNSFHPVPTTSFVLHKLEKVDLSSDEDSEESNLDQPGEYFEEEVKLEVKTEEVQESPGKSLGVEVASDHADRKGTKLEEPIREEFEVIGEYFEHENKVEPKDVKDDLAKVVSRENREPLKELQAENKVESKTDPVTVLTGKHQVGEYFEEETPVGKKEEKEESECEDNVAAGECFEEAGEFDKNYIHCTIENKDEWYHSESECFDDDCDIMREWDEVRVVEEIRAPDPEVEKLNAERAKTSNRKIETRKKLPNNRRKRTRLEIQEMKKIYRNCAQEKLAVEYSRRDREKLFNTLNAKVARIRSPSPGPSKTSPPTTRPTTSKTPTRTLSEDEVYSYPIRSPSPSSSKSSPPATRPTTPTTPTSDMSEDEMYSYPIS